MNRVINKDLRIRAGMERELAIRLELTVLRWFGHGENE